MEIVISFLLVGIFGLIVLLIVESIQAHRLIEEERALKIMTDSFIEAFMEVKHATNVNASTLRALSGATQRHDKMIAVADALIDIHSTALNVDQNLRGKLEATHLVDLPVEDLLEDDENGGTETT